MKILALDSSSLTASVAVVEDDITIAEYTVNYKKTHSQTLLPMLDEIVKMTEQDLQEIDAIAIAAGPGSFTGLRIGIGTIKGLAYGLGKPVVGVSTLESLAHNIDVTDLVICPIMDARRGQVYNGIYRYNESTLECIAEPRALSLEELCEELTERTIFVGDGVNVHKEKIKEILGENAVFASPQNLLQRAGSVAYAALSKKTVSAEGLTAVYLRKPQAEREREERKD